MITEVKDLFGNDFHIGDKVTWSACSSTSVSFLNYGVITDIIKHKIETHIKVKQIKSGAGQYWYDSSILTFKYPRNYHNLIIL